MSATVDQTGINRKLIQQGWFVRVFDQRRQETGKFYFVEAQQLGKSVHTFGDGQSSLAPVTSGSLAEGEPCKELEPVTKDIIHQCFFGVDKVNTFIYINVPAAIQRGGFDQKPKENSSNRLIGEIDGAISPFDAPSLETEFFCRTESVSPFPQLDCFNSTRFSQTPRIRFYVNRLLLGPVTPEAQKRLQDKVMPFTNIRLDPMPAGGGAPPSGGG